MKLDSNFKLPRSSKIHIMNAPNMKEFIIQCEYESKGQDFPDIYKIKPSKSKNNSAISMFDSIDTNKREKMNKKQKLTD